MNMTSPFAVLTAMLIDGLTEHDRLRYDELRMRGVLPIDALVDLEEQGRQAPKPTKARMEKTA